MYYSKYIGSNHRKWKILEHLSKNTLKGCHITFINSVCLELFEFILLKRLSSPTLSVWSMRIISQSFIPWCLSPSKWAWSDACLTVFLLIKLPWADFQLLNLNRNLSVLPAYYFEHILHEKKTHITGTTVHLIKLNAI